jgi:Tfp pilus assembly protein PilF
VDPKSSDRAGSGARARTALRWIALCLAVALCYANSLDVPFLMDDYQPGMELDYTTRPLVWATFELNRAWSGAETWSYHVLNALVHLGCGFLLLAVLRRMLERALPDAVAGARDGVAFVTTLLWLCHPLQTAAVTYLSQRAETMGAFFYLAVVYAFLRAASAARPLGWQVLAVLALALGFASKEIIATAPAMLYLYDALFVSPGVLAPLRRRPWFYAALALVTLALSVVYVAPPLLSKGSSSGIYYPDFGPLEYARTQPGVILHYLRLVFWPHPLCFDPGWPIARTPAEYLPQSVLIAALLSATAVLLRRRSWAGFASAAFFLVLAPTSSFVPIRDPAFEHRVYLSLAAVLALVAVGGWQIVSRRSLRAGRALPALSTVLVLALAALTVRRNQDYRSAVRLWQQTVELAPHHARAHDSLGGALLEAGRTEEAIPELLEALRLDSNAGYVYMNLGIAYMRLEQVDRAIPFFRRAAELQDPQAASALGHALTLKGDHAGAAAWLQQAVQLHPDNARIHYRLAESLERLGYAGEAAQHFEIAGTLDPSLRRAPSEASSAAGGSEQEGPRSRRRGTTHRRK